jgi:hypothetical protein
MILPYGYNLSSSIFYYGLFSVISPQKKYLLTVLFSLVAGDIILLFADRDEMYFIMV